MTNVLTSGILKFNVVQVTNSLDNTGPILLTSFAPFAGRAVNGSDTLIQGFSGHTICGAQIITARIPVMWGAPEKHLPDLIAEHNPQMVLSLGEGSSDAIRVELLAYNECQGTDEQGIHRTATKIQANGSRWRHARLRYDPDWFDHEPLPVLPSSHAGRFLCNNLLYVLSATDAPIIGFVHIPPQGDSLDDVYRQRIIRSIRILIERNLSSSSELHCHSSEIS